MDRPLDDGFVKRRRNVRIVGTIAVLSLFGLVFAKGPSLLTPSVAKSRLRTAVVDRGPLEASLTAGGSVVPEVEEVLSSPMDARVLRVLRRPGDRIAKGDAILELDLSAARLAVEKLDRDLALRGNKAEESRLALETRLNDLESQRRIRILRLESATSRVAQRQKLFSEGLVSDENLREARSGEAEARIELAQTEEAARIAKETARTELRGLALELATLKAERTEAERQRLLGTTRADREGVLTFTVTEEGAAVHRGDVLARIADLSRYRVDATISEVHAQRLSRGMPVVVKANDEALPGHVASIQPTLRGGVAAFTVALDRPDHPALRANLRVDVLVVTDRRDDVLRLPRGPFARGVAETVYVVSGDRAVKRRVSLGAASFTHFEVLSGLAEGDVAIVSDTSDYEHAREIRIR